MKAVILAGGLGTRLSEETATRPKPMVEIGGKPILWHILKMYSHHGINDFVICCGYKGYVIKEYFANYFLHMSDVTFDMSKNSMEVHQRSVPNPGRVTLVDTGADTDDRRTPEARRATTSQDDEAFCMTYGDGVSDMWTSPPCSSLSQARAVRPGDAHRHLFLQGALARWTCRDRQGDATFMEKPKGDGALINGGFFVLSPTVIGD